MPGGLAFEFLIPNKTTFMTSGGGPADCVGLLGEYKGVLNAQD